MGLAPSELAPSEPASPEGGPSPGADLGRLLIRDPASTLLLRVCGESLEGAGIRHGDLLVVDRGVRPRRGHIVVARLQGGFTVKRLERRSGQWYLQAAHPAYPDLALDGDAQLWGVVLHAIRQP